MKFGNTPLIQSLCLVLALVCLPFSIFAQHNAPSANIDFDGFVKLAQEVQEVRNDRLVDLNTFLEMAQDPNTIILDTRSKEAYDKIHLKGAVHLDFADFTQYKLARVIPSYKTRVLIYCNNNFHDYFGRTDLTGDDKAFASKGISAPPNMEMATMAKRSSPLALNIPTFITLYGYNYKNVYELSSLVNITASILQWQGTEAQRVTDAIRRVQGPVD